jgi:hypothetical protein
MIYENLFRRLCSIAFLGYGVFLSAQNYQVEVDDYFSYKEIHSGDKDLIFQPLFNILFSSLGFIDYDYTRFAIGLIITAFLSFSIFACRSRFWYLLIITFAWYLESLAIVHIRMGLAFALFALIYPRWRNPLLIIIISLIHYSILFYLLFYIALRINRFFAALSLCLCVLLYNFASWVDYFSDFDQYRIYVDVIPDGYLSYAFFGILGITFFLTVYQGIFVRFVFLVAFVVLSKLFLGVELGGRLSSIFILYLALLAAYPVLYTTDFFRQGRRWVLYSRSKIKKGSPHRSEIALAQSTL